MIPIHSCTFLCFAMPGCAGMTATPKWESHFWIRVGVRCLAKCDIFACAQLCTFSQWISTIVFFTHWRSRDFLAVRIVARAAVDGPCSRNHSVRSVWCAPIWTRFLRFQNRTNHTGVAVVLGGLCLATQVSMWCGAHTVAATSGVWGRGVLAVDALEVHLPRVRIFIVSL